MSHHQSVKTKYFSVRGLFYMVFKQKCSPIHVGWEYNLNRPFFLQIQPCFYVIRLIKLFYNLDLTPKNNISSRAKVILFQQNSKHAPIRTGHYSNWISMIFPPIFTITFFTLPLQQMFNEIQI